MTHYRVELTLSEVNEYTDGQGYERDRVCKIAILDLTAGSPGSAMAQILPHVQRLSEWHGMVEAKVDVAAIGDRRRLPCPACGSRERALSINGCVHAWHLPEVKVPHDGR